MEADQFEPITFFDNRYTTTGALTLKLLFRHFDPSLRPYLAAYIRFSELRYTLSLLSTHSDLCQVSDCKCPSQSNEFKKNMDMMRNFRQMQEMMSLLSSLGLDSMDLSNLDLSNIDLSNLDFSGMDLNSFFQNKE